MTVAELIELLRGFDPELPVLAACCVGGEAEAVTNATVYEADDPEDFMPAPAHVYLFHA